MGFQEKTKSIDRAIQILEIKKQQAITKALSGNDPNDILKARDEFEGILQKVESQKKSFLFDPQSFQQSMGFKDKPTAMSYALLRNMGRTSIINAVIKTRINQVASFAEPQRDKYSLGYKIQKRANFAGEEQKELTTLERKEIDGIMNFLENCGRNNKWDGDDFDAFIRKITRDSLVYDQSCFEVVRDRRGLPVEFFAIDGASIRIAQSYEDAKEEQKFYKTPQEGQNTFRSFYSNPFNNSKEKEVKGYYPSHVQIYNQMVVAEFLPWEICFGIRNPDTNLYLLGYGTSELEELVSTITGLLWGEEYNRRFFKQGSAPKGILKVKNASLNPSKLQEFRQEWMATMRGIGGAHRTPIMDGDVDFVDLQKNSRDMEWGKWLEFLIKISCAVFLIDPAEVNFPLSGNSAGRALFEGSNEARIKHSKDKGLSPLLRFHQKRLNKYLITPLNPKYELAFCGIDSATPKEELELDSLAVKTCNTVNEIRKKRGDKPIEGGDIILDGIFTQTLQMEKQNEMMSQQGVQEGNEDVNPEGQGDEEENPFTKAFTDYFNKL